MKLMPSMNLKSELI